MTTQYHASVIMQGSGPFSRTVQHVEDIKELHSFVINDRRVYMYSGRLWSQSLSRWMMLVGTAIVPKDTVEDFPYEQAVWAGSWQ